MNTIDRIADLSQIWKQAAQVFPTSIKTASTGIRRMLIICLRLWPRRVSGRIICCWRSL